MTTFARTAIPSSRVNEPGRNVSYSPASHPSCHSQCACFLPEADINPPGSFSSSYTITAVCVLPGRLHDADIPASLPLRLIRGEPELEMLLADERPALSGDGAGLLFFSAEAPEVFANVR
jgi:hypothetical protein